MFDGNFDRRFEKARRRHDMMFRVVMTLFVIAFITIVCFWIFVGTVAVNTVTQVDQHGIKGVVEQIWCGKDSPNCLDLHSNK